MCGFNDWLKETYGEKNRCVFKLFVCAIGACPTYVIERLHKANVLVMNMTGSVRN